MITAVARDARPSLLLAHAMNPVIRVVLRPPSAGVSGPSPCSSSVAGEVAGCCEFRRLAGCADASLGSTSPGTTGPTVDRLLHHAHLCATAGDSIRLAQATSGKGGMPLTS